VAFQGHRSFTAIQAAIRPLRVSKILLLALSLTATTASADGLNSSKQRLQISPPNDSSPVKNLEGSWKLTLSAHDTRDDLNQTSGVVYSGDLNLRYHLTPWLLLNGAPSLKGKSGHVQTESDASLTGAESATFQVRNASADFMFLQNSRLQLGIANQGEVHTPLLISEKGFPAIRLQLRAQEEEFVQWSSFAQAAVPTSSSLTTNSREFEPTPSFNSVGVGGGVLSSQVEWRSQLAAFEYKNLPTTVSSASGLLGNSVQITNSTDSQFVYACRGIEAQSKGMARLNHRWQLNFELSALQNTSAPKGLNTGVFGQLATSYQLNSRFTLKPFVESFRIEPDASVAYYSSNQLQPNTVGYRGGISARYQNIFSIAGSGGERAPIFLSPSQLRERFIDITLETLDAKF